MMLTGFHSPTVYFMKFIRFYKWYNLINNPISCLLRSNTKVTFPSSFPPLILADYNLIINFSSSFKSICSFPSSPFSFKYLSYYYFSVNTLNPLL